MEIAVCRPVAFTRPPPALKAVYLCALLFQEYNIHGWWVGELNGVVGIVPKDYLLPAYIL